VEVLYPRKNFVIATVGPHLPFFRIPALARALLVVLLVGLAACEREQYEPGMITREQFIRVNVDLRSIPRNADDIEERRQQVLEEHGLTQEQILDFIERSNYTPEQLRRLWGEITDRLEELQPEHPPGGQSI
jgi:hypothetical protein